MKKILELLYKLFKIKRKTAIILTINSKTNDMQVEQNKWASVTPQLVDHNTQTPIQASFSDIQLESSNSSIFKIEDVNGDGYQDIVGVSLGVAVLKYQTDATYIDANTGQSTIQHKEIEEEITVIEEVVAQETDLKLNISDSQPF